MDLIGYSPYHRVAPSALTQGAAHARACVCVYVCACVCVCVFCGVQKDVCRAYESLAGVPLVTTSCE
jgi:hypothetical protein